MHRYLCIHIQVRREPPQEPELFVQPKQGVRGVLGHGLVFRAASGRRVCILQNILRDRGKTQQTRSTQWTDIKGNDLRDYGHNSQ